MANGEMERVAFCGLGIMGGPMAAHLARAGFELSVYTRTREKAESFAAEHGARAAATPREAAEGASAAITMVPDAPEVEEVLLGEQGAVHGLGEGALAIDMSTIAPTAARAIAERLGERGVAFLDAPVTGSRPKAEDATLTIMVGGPSDLFEECKPVLEVIGKNVIHCGDNGMGEVVKVVNNLIAGVSMAVVAEAFNIGVKAGADPKVMFEVITKSSGKCWSLDTVLPYEGVLPDAPVNRDFAPGFMVEHFIKDMEITLAEARRLELALPGLALAHELYLALRAQGNGRDGVHALIHALARLSAVDWKT